jgi:N-succinyldiaminopimelate aminotransferase
LQYRTYHGCALPVPTQLASIAAWNDEKHVQENRELYRQKFAAVFDILKDHLDLTMPDGGFYFWPRTPYSDTDFARDLFAQQNLTVLPGQYLARPTAQGNPGENRIRLALVATLNECCEAAERLRRFLETR